MDIDPHQMCFGLNLELDRESLTAFLQLMGRPSLAETLAGRLSSTEIHELVQSLTGVLKNHMSEAEYHQLFLNETPPHSHK